MDFDWISFLLGLVSSGVIIYSTSFIQDMAKSHRKHLVESSKTKRVNKDQKAIVDFLKENRGHHDLDTIRNKVFNNDQKVTKGYIEELLNKQFNDERNVKRFKGTDWWFYYGESE